MMKREDYISWNDYFMSVAKLSAMRSKDPSTQVGACIVDDKNRIVGIGYNGFPNGCSDDALPWEKSGKSLETKYFYVVHAESNAIVNSKSDISGASMYITLFPCNECAKLMVQSGIKHIYYLEDTYHDRDFSVAARRIFDLVGITYEQYEPSVSDVTICLKETND